MFINFTSILTIRLDNDPIFLINTKLVWSRKIAIILL